MKRSLTDYPLAGKRVLVRVDFNVPLDGRPRGRRHAHPRRAAHHQVPARPGLRAWCSPRTSAGPRARWSTASAWRRWPRGSPSCWAAPWPPWTTASGPVVEQAAASACEPGEVLLLENLRFHAEETANDAAFAKQLAGLAQVYVNDAFGTAHRAHASTEGVTHYLPSVAGLLMTRELQILGRLLRDPARPFVVVLGGLKVSDKIGVIEKMLDHRRRDPHRRRHGQRLPRRPGATASACPGRDGRRGRRQAARVLGGRGGVACALVLPRDVVVAREAAAGAPSRVVRGRRHRRRRHGARRRPADGGGVRAAHRGAGTIYWNGPMGLFELDEFSAGTRPSARPSRRAPRSPWPAAATRSRRRGLRPGGAHDPRDHRRRCVDGVP